MKIRKTKTPPHIAKTKTTSSTHAGIKLDYRNKQIVQKPYTPPAGFPADPQEWLDYMKAGVFTAEQKNYLWSNAYSVYMSALASAKDNQELKKEVDLGYQIVAVWTLWLKDNPKPTSNPFGSIAG